MAIINRTIEFKEGITKKITLFSTKQQLYDKKYINITKKINIDINTEI